MNKLSLDEQNLLYWHAVSKMHQGSFLAARIIFAYLFDKNPAFYIGLACAYCASRDGDGEYAKGVLQTLTPENLAQTKLLNRLTRRLEGA